MTRKILFCVLLFGVYQMACCSEISYKLGLYKKQKLTLLNYHQTKKVESKKFGEDVYNSFKNTEKKLKDTIKGIIIPSFLEENMDIDIKLAKEFEFTCSYKYEF